MRGFICFIAACAVYILCGLLVWTIVWSMTDVLSTTIEKLNEYELYSYSGVAATACGLSLLFSRESETTFEVILGVIAVSLLIGVAAISWDLSSGVLTVLSLIYNTVNVGAITLSFYLASEN